jgi:hypothetical protein
MKIFQGRAARSRESPVAKCLRMGPAQTNQNIWLLRDLPRRHDAVVLCSFSTDVLQFTLNILTANNLALALGADARPHWPGPDGNE